MPNLSAWRRSAVRDLTAAFNFVAPNQSVPVVPAPSLADPRVLASDCPTNAPVGFIDENFPTVKSYPVPPPPQQMPTQEAGRRGRPSGLVNCQEEGSESEVEQEQESANGGEEQESLGDPSLLQTLLPPL